MPSLLPFLEVNILKKLIKRGVEAIEMDDTTVIILGQYFFVMRKGVVTPALVPFNSELLEKIPSVWVDQGAVSRIASGADVMRPGITRMDVFRKGDNVVVRDEKFSKPIAVGQALTSSAEAAAMAHGRVVKNLHHVDDRVWKTIKTMIGW